MENEKSQNFLAFPANNHFCTGSSQISSNISNFSPFSNQPTNKNSISNPNLKMEQSIPSKTPKLYNQYNQNPSKTLNLPANFTPKNPGEFPKKVVTFQSWYKTHQSWSNWVEKLSLKHALKWEISDICDGILSSLHEIKPNPDIILGLCEYWCSKTNTFVFPWGVSTVTLEDVFVLAGLPVVGEPVNVGVSGDCGKILEEKLYRVKRVLCMRSFRGKVSNLDWIKHFNAECGGVEHVGFLVYWLSSFVFPDLCDGEVSCDVFSIAVNLAQGVKIALGPAVLACLYRNLTVLSRDSDGFDCVERGEVCVPGCFQILQLWALERFPLLGFRLAKPLSLGQPRVARWDQVSVMVKLDDLRSVLRSGRGFCRRPYAMKLENWRCRTLCLDNGKIISGCLDDDDDELRSFRVFLQSQELVGIDCNAMYYPQFVYTQFECDREVSPRSPLESNHISFIVESKSFLGSVDDKKPVLAPCSITQSVADCLDDSSLKTVCSRIEIEIVNASRSDSGGGGKRNCCESLEVLVILDSDEEETDELHLKNLSRTNAKKAKTSLGDSPENPLYVADHFSKVSNCVKRSGISREHPIDIEDYCVLSD